MKYSLSTIVCSWWWRYCLLGATTHAWVLIPPLPPISMGTSTTVRTINSITTTTTTTSLQQQDQPDNDGIDPLEQRRMRLQQQQQQAASDGTDPMGLFRTPEELEMQMARLRSKYPTTEAAYLAAARERARAKVPSREQAATDTDWQRMAQEKKQIMGDQVDDWEMAKEEADIADNQALLPLIIEESSDDDEPKLLLF